MELHIIYTENAMLISRKKYSSWQEIQNEFVDYKASLGPWSEDEVTEYLLDDYPELFPSVHTQISKLINEDCDYLPLVEYKNVD